MPNSAFEIAKFSFEQFVVNAARDHGLLYGFATAVDGAGDGLDRERRVFARIDFACNGRRLIRQAPLGGDGEQPTLAEHVRGERKRAEQTEDRAVAHVEAAGIREERRA